MGIVYDKIMRAGATVAASSMSEADAGQLFGLLEAAVVIDAGRAMRYFRAETEDDPKFLPSDVPNLRPLFAVSFIEGASGTGDGGGGIGGLVGGQRSAQGYLCRAVDLRDPRLPSSTDREIRDFLYRVCGPRAYGDGIRWVLSVHLFVASAEETLAMGPLMGWLLPIRDDGSIEVDSGGYDPSLMSVPGMGNPEEDALREELAAEAMGELLTVLFVIGAINSPLTELRPLTRPPGERYVLVADRLTSKLDGVGNARSAGLAHALTACRSHFFETGEEAK